MPQRPRPPADPEKRARLQAELRRDRARREAGYRSRALKLFPHVCARCGREFSGRRLRELTVHHRDHDHTHNPNDGSNWELLCLYCHDNEHEKTLNGGRRIGEPPADDGGSGFRVFEGLDALLPKPSQPGKDTTP